MYSQTRPNLLFLIAATLFSSDGLTPYSLTESLTKKQVQAPKMRLQDNSDMTLKNTTRTLHGNLHKDLHVGLCRVNAQRGHSIPSAAVRPLFRTRR